MNTIELDQILRKILRRCFFTGVFACDQLPKEPALERPLALIVNTDPSHKDGSHWLAIYIDRSNNATFYDSFGNPPEMFDDAISEFLGTNSVRIQYSTRAIQSMCTAVCGQHCIYFIARMEKCEDFGFFISLFKENTHLNDVKVCRFVKKLQPLVSCKTLDNALCLQCAVSGELIHCN